jgi:hypothetical protein
VLPAPRRTLLSAGVLSAALALSACTGSSSSSSSTSAAELKPGVAVAPEAKSAPKPAPTLAAPIEKLATTTDVGEFLVTPDKELGSAQVKGAVARLSAMKGVQSAALTPEGKVDLVFRGDGTKPQRVAAVKQLAALGTVEEGI